MQLHGKVRKRSYGKAAARAKKLEWLLFRTPPAAAPTGLGADQLDRAVALHLKAGDRPRRSAAEARQASTLPLLVPEVDNGDEVLGHCYFLTPPECDVGGEEAQAEGEDLARGAPSRGDIEASRGGFGARVDQRFALSMGKRSERDDNDDDDGSEADDSTAHLVVSTHFSTGGIALNDIKIGSNTSPRHIRMSVRLTRSGELERPDMRVAIDVRPTAPEPSADMRQTKPPPSTSLWRCFERFAYTALRPTRVQKRVILHAAAGGGGGGGAEDGGLREVGRASFPTMLQALHGAQLQRVKTEYVQERLEAMMSPCRASVSALPLVRAAARRDAAPCGTRYSEAAPLHLFQGHAPPSPSAEAGEVVESKAWRCATCGAHFRGKYEMERHVRSVHMRQTRFACEHCGRAFYQRSHLRTHVREVHEGRRNYACKLCSRRYLSAEKLRRHIRGVHQRERHFNCDRCAGTFFQRSDLLRHQRLKHKLAEPL